jgi:hypothetical protein
LTLTWNWACFSSKNVYVSFSPDAAWKLVVGQRCAFPRNEFVDPAQVIAWTRTATSNRQTWLRGGAQVKGLTHRPRRLETPMIERWEDQDIYINEHCDKLGLQSWKIVSSKAVLRA